MLGRKKIIQDILRCARCSLIFRYPQDSARRTSRYYRSSYRSGSVTDLPTADQLERWRADAFGGTVLDLRPKIALLKEMVPGGRLLDFGSSWGYGTLQLRLDGFDAVGYEPSERRAHFGRKSLGVEIHSDPGWLTALQDGSFDAIFTNHVLEHLGRDLRKSLDLFSRLLLPRGPMFHVLPNFEGLTAREGAFWDWIGEAHPIAPGRRFFELNLPAHGFGSVLIGTGPFDRELQHEIASGNREVDTGGDELFVVARKEPD